jgi:hypothetical protein
MLNFILGDNMRNELQIVISYHIDFTFMNQGTNRVLMMRKKTGGQNLKPDYILNIEALPIVKIHD